jgi:hypothetical protein
MGHLDHEAWVEGLSRAQTQGPEDIGILEKSRTWTSRSHAMDVLAPCRQFGKNEDLDVSRFLHADKHRLGNDSPPETTKTIRLRPSSFSRLSQVICAFINRWRYGKQTGVQKTLTFYRSTRCHIS